MPSSLCINGETLTDQFLEVTTQACPRTMLLDARFALAAETAATMPHTADVRLLRLINTIYGDAADIPSPRYI